MERSNYEVDVENAGSKPENEVVGPEELLRRETKAVNLSRGLLIVILIVVGGLLAVGTYKWGSNTEDAAYHDGFAAVSAKLTDSFLSIIAQSMWNAYAVGMVVSANGEIANSSPNITIPMFQKLASGAIQVAGSGKVLWSPVIPDEKTKISWEAYAQQQINASSIQTDRNECYICGSPGLEVGTPDVAVNTISGTYSCGDLNAAAMQGLIAESDCSFFATYVLAHCECRPTSNTTESKKQPSTPRSTEVYEVIEGNVTKAESNGPFSPIWQVYPAGEWASVAMFDLFSDPVSSGALKEMMSTHKTVFSEIYNMPTSGDSNIERARSLMFSPVSAISTKDNIIGSISFDVDWASFLTEAVPPGSKGLTVVLENSFGQQYTFRSDGTAVDVVGEGDLHDSAFSSIVEQSSFDDYFAVQNYAAPLRSTATSQQNCAYRLIIYASHEFRSNYVSSKPGIQAVAVILTFAFMSLLLVAHDCYVARRLKKVLTAALQRDEIVSNLFPAGVQERLFQRGQATRRASLGKKNTCVLSPHPRSQLRRVMSASSLSVTSASTDVPLKPEPIADFFPSVTVVFADISGFTAWSSEREPSHVFHLLETVYQTFDKIAERFGVFKIETIGDCYVAVAGVPQYQPDHAVRIVKFAYECIVHMQELTKDLQSSLGPSTSSLSIRIGIHSGPVIAGVLRGEKSRFQLFGDTMNTTSRMQTTGEINKIQISTTTADLLVQAGKSHWIRPREKPVAMKGKGIAQTFWVDTVFSATAETEDNGRDISCLLFSENVGSPENTKMIKMIEWNTDVFLRLLERLAARREVSRKRRTSLAGLTRRNSMTSNRTPLEDLTEIIPMDIFLDKEVSHEQVDLGHIVRSQVHDYAVTIASMHKNNLFHNFDHAIFVVSSANKAVERIIQHSSNYAQGSRGSNTAERKASHNNTFGISSDVLVQFALVFAAFVHNIGHTGVTNSQLVKEGDELAERYSNKSVSEQNSADIAWNLLMEERYRELRQCICNGEQELQRFRQLLVGAIVATDLTNDDLQIKRNKRWDRAFHDSCDWYVDSLDAKVEMDRKATIVVEFIMQASVEAHTMQAWNVYTYWNELLFKEQYHAFLDGREEHDPSKSWYQKQMLLFDDCIIPLAKKLETCGVFGASSSELLSHACDNRRKWESMGEDILRQLVLALK